jgi:RNA-directed DNA polymerase
VSLRTPTTVGKLQTALHEKAKAEPDYRFYSLWDKIWRIDVLTHAYARCRANGGSAGVDGETFRDIEDQGRDRWLGNLQEELRSKRYAPRPLLRVWIPKSNGGERPLGIPTIRDRVVQMAMVLVIGPIFEADLLPQQYGFRPGLDAKMAVRRVYFHLTDCRRTEVVDGDLKDYFNTIPHGPLMKCAARRVADGQVLSVIRAWLRAPVEERQGRRIQRRAEARRTQRGTPQGGVISPMLSNLYFRRFVLAWQKIKLTDKLDAHLVNYADDLVICCRPGGGAEALERMRSLMGRLGLTVNEDKTRLVNLPREEMTFLGYTFRTCYTRKGRPYLGTRPSKKALKRVCRRIHDETSTRWITSTPEKRVEEINRIVRGWCGYFNQGPVFREYRMITAYTARRLRRWLMKKHKRRGTGYRQYPDEYLYERLGLYKPWVKHHDQPSAKSRGPG